MPPSLYDLDPKGTRRQREYDSQRATRSPRPGESTKGVSESNWRQKLEVERWIEETKMPSSKGEPTDPELREKIREEVKAEEKGTLCLSSPTTLRSSTELLLKFVQEEAKATGRRGKLGRWRGDTRLPGVTTRTQEITRIRRRKASPRRSLGQSDLGRSDLGRSDLGRSD